MNRKEVIVMGAEVDPTAEARMSGRGWEKREGYNGH